MASRSTSASRSARCRRASVVGFVDVPGHVRFVKNMLAGVGAVDVALLVVAANEGWMPQTEEHVQILELLGIAHGVVALTKADLVDDETLELAAARDRTTGSTGRSSSSTPPTGRGVDEVATALDDVLRRRTGTARRQPAATLGRSVFAAKGSRHRRDGHADRRLDRSRRRRRWSNPAAAAHACGGSSRTTSGSTASTGHARRVQPRWCRPRRSRRGDAVVRAEQWAVVSVVDVALRAVPGHELAQARPRRRARRLG